MDLNEKEKKVRRYSSSERRAHYIKYKETYKAYYQKNKKRIQKQQKRYRAANPELIKDLSKNEKYKVARNKWFKKHKKEVKEYQYRYYHEVVKPKRQALREEKLKRLGKDD